MPRLCKAVREELTLSMRAKIRETFSRLLAEDRDQSGVTMDSLSAELGVAKGTLYLYYKTKDEIVRDTLEEGRNALFRRLREEVDPIREGADVKLMVYARILFEEFTRNRWIRLEFVRKNPLPYSERRMREHLSVIEAILNEGIREGVFRPVPVLDTAFFIRSAILGQFRHFLRSGENVDMPRVLALFEDMILRALKKNP